VAKQQTHRGPAPEDNRLFAPRRLPALRAAAADLCWLLDRDYAQRSALELVGNRYNLTARQRMALARYACSNEDCLRRNKLRIEPERLKGEELWLDGYNILTMIESALAGGVILLCRDGCCRDIAGIHRRYRKVNETIPALKLVAESVAALGVSNCRWWLDQPVSNSGRLKSLILESARDAGWNMEVDLTFSPDHVLSRTDHIIATSDGIVLNRCRRWVNLVRLIIAERIPQARTIDFSPC
jgi:cyclic lactone autoinducer peptide